MAESLVDRIKSRALEDPKKPAFIFVDKHFRRTVLTREDVWVLSQKFAAILRRKGVGRGDVVCNTLPNSPERLITQLGTVMAGAIDMNGQIALADGQDFIFSLNQGQAKVLILDPNDKDGAIRIMESRLNDGDATRSGKVQCHEVPSLELLISVVFGESSNGSSLMSEILEENELFHDHVKADDECAYLCTSGSTGFFKLVLFTSENLLEFGQVFMDVVHVTEKSMYFNDRSLGWLGGYPVFYLASGCTRVIMNASSGRPNNYVSFLWELFYKERCTVAFTVPLLLESLKIEATKNPHSDGYLLEGVSCGGGPTSRSSIDAIGKATKRVFIVYASTEGGVITSMEVTKPDEYDNFTSGVPTRGSKIRIVDENFRDVPAGHNGEVLFSTTQTVSRYVNDVKNTEETFLPGGWVRLGDIGKIDEKGNLSVLSRRKFAILRGPFVVYPDQLEIRIKQCPGVGDICITGVPDEKQYENICALIVPKKEAQMTSDAVKKFCEDTLFLKKENVELNPMPAYFLLVDTLPTLSNGKLDRNAAKSMACDLLGL